jgi:hypothetical protein
VATTRKTITKDVLYHRDEATEAFQTAWGIFHRGHGDDLDRLTEAFRGLVMSHGRWLGLANVNAILCLLDDLKLDDLAGELARHWVNVQSKPGGMALSRDDNGIW